ncbi:MAG: 1-acyl-sn-glycerol-3-phosphate acyltransferase [Bacteroidales bacterium]
MQQKVIDIRKQILNSNSKLLKNMPDPVLSLLERIVRQDEMNFMLSKYSQNSGVDFLSNILTEMDIRIDVQGIENLPDHSKCFFVANHPFGIADGLVLTNIVAQKYGELKAIGNDVFMLIPQMRPIIAAVSVFGKNSREYYVELEKVYKSDIAITHFPAGLVSRISKFKVAESTWKKSFITKSVECQRDIVPIHFVGRNSILFYSVFKFRKALGINATLELALLPHEFFNKRNRTIKVVIGRPISYKTFNNNKSNEEWAQWVKNQCLAN